MNIEWQPAGNLTTLVSVKNGSEPAWTDTVRIVSANLRAEFIERTLKRFPTFDRLDLEHHLDGIAAEMFKQASEKKKPKAEGEAPETNGLDMSAPIPWDDPVNGAELLDSIAAVFRRFMVLPAHGADVIALWILFAHAIESFDVAPLLVFSSPTKRCGKTRALSLLLEMAPIALPASNISAAAVFRSIEMWKPTLLIDEAETLFGKDGSEELRAVIDSGHTRATASTVKCVGDDHTPTVFSTWAPKVLALIGKLPSTIDDRSIVIAMRRKGQGEAVERLRISRIRPDLRILCRKCARWSNDHAEELRALDLDFLPLSSDRAADNWNQLNVVAAVAGGEWPRRCREAAFALSAEADEDGIGEMLVCDLRDFFNARKIDRAASVEICEHLAGLEDHPWGEWRRGKPITPNGLARILKSFGVKPKTLRLTHAPRAKGYYLMDLQDTFSRYTPPATVTAVTCPELQGNSETLNRDKTPSVAPTVTGQPSDKQGDLPLCHGVTVGKGGVEEKKVSGQRSVEVYEI